MPLHVCGSSLSTCSLHVGGSSPSRLTHRMHVLTDKGLCRVLSPIASAVHFYRLLLLPQATCLSTELEQSLRQQEMRHHRSRRPWKFASSLCCGAKVGKSHAVCVIHSLSPDSCRQPPAANASPLRVVFPAPCLADSGELSDDGFAQTQTHPFSVALSSLVVVFVCFQ